MSGQLYRVTHRHRAHGTAYINEIVADGPGDAINQRCVELGIDDDEPYDITVDAVPDPDGRKAAHWLQHFGGPR